MSSSSLNTGAARWVLPVLLALMPLWALGTLYRGLWTPDEPRVADISWRMAQQKHWVLPQLAGKPFLEKPPLSYWTAAASVRAFGDSPAALRAPNLLYALVSALALGALGFAMDGPVAAIVAALVAGTAITVFRVSVWLAPDACLLAGCAVALLGAFLGYTAAPGRRKLLGYTLMHVGAAVGFMAKSAVGWLVPGLTLLTLIAWERRWSELKRGELYAGLLVQALIIAPWLFALTRTAHGGHALLVMFWYNLAGRFTRIAAPVAYRYATAHHNSFGKYFLQLPVYLLPWTALAAVAVRRAWDRMRLSGPIGTRWRFAAAASLPMLVLLSLAATARDIYAAPALLGFGLLSALWASEAQRLPARGAQAMRWTRRIVAVFAGLCAVAVACLGSADSLAGAHRRLALANTFGYLAIASIIVACALLMLIRAARAQRRGEFLGGFGWTYAAYAAVFCLSALAVFPIVDRWQNLPALARRIHTDTAHDSLALLNPDETTVAMLDRGLSTRFVTLDANGYQARSLVARWFATHGRDARVLVLLPGHAPGPLSSLLARVHLWHRSGDGQAGVLRAAGVASIARRYQLPQGRRYALLAPPYMTSSYDGDR